MVMFLALVALCLSGSALANVPSSRGCPAVTTQSNFDVNKYLGRWYVNQKFSDSQSATESSKCTYADYTSDGNSVIHIINYYINVKSDKPATLESYLRVPNPNDASKMKIRYPSLMPPGVEGDYYVLATDYDTYAVVYNCQENRGVGTRHIWTLTREQNPSAEIVNNADSALEKNNINRSLMRKVDQTNC